MDNQVHRGQDQQYENCRCYHPADDDSGQWLLGFRADARRNGRRKQADSRSECSHQYRAQLQFGAFSNGIA